MPYGLRVWDANGNNILDTTDRISRYHSTITLGSFSSLQTISFNVPGIVDNGTWFLQIVGGSIQYIYMYITTDYITMINKATFTVDLTGKTIDIYRG